MKPLTRIENFLAKIAGNPAANAEMQPRTRKEYFLNEIAENGGGGGGSGSSGTMVVQFDSDNDRFEATWQEVHDAMTDGKTVKFVYAESDYLYHHYAVMATSADSEYRIGAVTVTSTEGNWDVDFISLSASGANGYLIFD